MKSFTVAVILLSVLCHSFPVDNDLFNDLEYNFNDLTFGRINLTDDLILFTPSTAQENTFLSSFKDIALTEDESDTLIEIASLRSSLEDIADSFESLKVPIIITDLQVFSIQLQRSFEKTYGHVENHNDLRNDRPNESFDRHDFDHERKSDSPLEELKGAQVEQLKNLKEILVIFLNGKKDVEDEERMFTRFASFKENYAGHDMVASIKEVKSEIDVLALGSKILSKRIDSLMEAI